MKMPQRGGDAVLRGLTFAAGKAGTACGLGQAFDPSGLCGSKSASETLELRGSESMGQ